MPRSCTTGVWNRPSDWRNPMAMLSMMAAPLSMAMACPRVTRLVWKGSAAEVIRAIGMLLLGIAWRVGREDKARASSNDKWGSLL
jgi:hypothetical protein